MLDPYAELVNIKRMKYYYDRGDYEGMRSKWEYINWDEVLSGDTIDEQWESLKVIIKILEDEFIPHTEWSDLVTGIKVKYH